VCYALTAVVSHPLAELRPGDLVRDYEVEGLLGQGGFGRVYKAYHPRLRRRAAIKVMSEWPDAQALARFEREAQAVAALRHPSILTVFDFGELQGEPFMVLEFMPNGTLADRLTDQPMAAQEVVALLGPIADALDHAHAQGVIHRDIKPANVFLDAGLQPVLGDFGLSRTGAETITISGSISGTPAYIAPEQAQGGEPTGASDNYALAVMTFQMLTGYLPFRSDVGPLAVLFQHVSQAPPAASGLNPDLPAAVDEVLSRGMAKLPGDRWPSARLFVKALADALGVPAPSHLPAAASEPPARLGVPATRRVPAWFPAAGLGALTVAAALVLVAVLRPGQAPAAAAPPAAAPANRAPGGITVESATNLERGREVHVSGGPLDPGRQVTIFIRQGLTNALIVGDGEVSPGADGSFDARGVVNPSLKAGDATLEACNLSGPHQVVDSTCLTTPVRITG
jgi:serine/threonine kinase PknH